MTLRTSLWESLSPVSPGTLIWADQNGPRPGIPYATMKLTSRRKVHHDSYGDVDANGKMKIKGNREYTLRVERHGPGSVEALEEFVDRLFSVTAIDRFQAAGIAVFDVEAIDDISALLGEVDIEKRAAVDIMVRVRSEIIDDVGLIETVNINAKDDGAKSPEYNFTIRL